MAPLSTRAYGQQAQTETFFLYSSLSFLRLLICPDIFSTFSDCFSYFCSTAVRCASKSFCMDQQGCQHPRIIHLPRSSCRGAANILPRRPPHKDLFFRSSLPGFFDLLLEEAKLFGLEVQQTKLLTAAPRTCFTQCYNEAAGEMRGTPNHCALLARPCAFAPCPRATVPSAHSWRLRF